MNISQECPRVMKGIITTSEGGRGERERGGMREEGMKRVRERERGGKGREKKEKTNEEMKGEKQRVVLSYHT